MQEVINTSNDFIETEEDHYYLESDIEASDDDIVARSCDSSDKEKIDLRTAV